MAPRPAGQTLKPQPTQYDMEQETTAETLCRQHFDALLKEAFGQAGGAINMGLTLMDARNTLAQNGIRLTYNPNWHVSCVEERLKKIFN